MPLTSLDRVILSSLEAVEIACRKAATQPNVDTATAIADALREHRRTLTDLLLAVPGPVR